MANAETGLSSESKTIGDLHMTASNRFMNKNFLLLWQGQIVSQFGTQLFQVIVILCLKQATESATAVGLFMMAYTLPTVLLGPLGGVLVDRCSRRGVLVAGDFLRGLILISLALVLWFAPHSSHILVTSLFLYSLVEGAIGAVWQPTGLSVVPDLVPKENLSGANSIMQGSFQVCTVLAQAFAGILFRVLGTPVLMLIDGLSYVYAAVAPEQGLMTSLILPSADTAMMNLFLAHVGEVFSDYFIVMQVDQAGWHRSKELQVPGNIRLIFQPAYSPELNPVEHLWEELREKFLHNLIFPSLDELISVLCTGLNQLTDDQKLLRSMMFFPHFRIKA